MKKILLVLLVISAMMACKSEPRNNYTISATFKGVPDNTLIILLKDGGVLDSLRIQNETVNITGTIERPMPVELGVAYSRDKKRFWLYNTDITIEGNKDDLRNAKVTGSVYQDEKIVYDKAMMKFEDMEEELRRYVEEEVEEMTLELRDSLINVMNDIENQSYQAVVDYMIENPNSLIGAYYLDFYKTSMTKEQAKSGYDKMTDEMKNSYYGKELEKYFIKRNMVLGEKYADITLNNTKGEPTSLSDNMGSVTLIEFWAEWCVPCRESNPELVKIYNKFQPKGFEVFGVSFDRGKKEWFQAIEEDQLPWTNVIDQSGQKGDVGLQYGINMLPWNVLLDKDGIIIGRNIEPQQLSAQLSNLLP